MRGMISVITGLMLVAGLGGKTLAAAELGLVAGPAEMVVTLYPGQSRAQVCERWAVQLPAGESRLALSWGGARVEAGSPVLEVEGAEVLEALQLRGVERGMQWRLKCPQAGVMKSRVTYTVEGFKWQPGYELHLLAEGQSATLVGQLAVTNESGLELQQARVRVALGGVGVVDRLGEGGPAAEGQAEADWVAEVGYPCTLALGDSAWWEFLRLKSLPLENIYRYEPERDVNKVTRALRLSGSSGRGPALQNLPPGPLAIYEDSAVPAWQTQLSPKAGHPLEVALGTEADLVVERILTGSWRSEFETDRLGRVSGFDTTEAYEVRLRNHTATAVVVEVVETVLSTWQLETTRAPDEQDATSATFHLPVAAGKEVELQFTLVKHAGTRAKK